MTNLAHTFSRIPGVRVEADADLRLYSRWRVGGRADLLVEPSDSAGALLCLKELQERNIPRLVIGDGSNILFDDTGFGGVIVRIGRRLSGIEISGQTATIEGGAWVPHVIRRLGRAGLGGLQHAIGIPGTFGGLVIMNGGSQRKGVGSVIARVSGCTLAGEPFERKHEDCKFRYRASSLQDDGLIILRAELALEAADPHDLRREMVEILAGRRRKFPKNFPNCGSVFLSDPAMYEVVGPPGAAIERVGLKGLRFGDAQISPLHANFIVNVGAARSSEILHLINLIRAEVHAHTGFWMDSEVRHVERDGRVRPAHVAAAERDRVPTVISADCRKA